MSKFVLVKRELLEDLLGSAQAEAAERRAALGDFRPQVQAELDRVVSETKAVLAQEPTLLEHCKQCAEFVKAWPESKRDCLGKIESVLAHEAGRGEAIYLYRRKGNQEWATCDRPRFVELSSHKLFTTKVCYDSPPPQHPILKVLSDPQAMELVALKATVAQQAQLIAWLKKGRGEAVAWLDRESGALVTDKLKPLLCETGFDIPLYVSPPAPVSMMLPDLDTTFEAWWESDGQYCRSGGGSYEKTFAYRAYEAAIDKVKELNQ